MAPVLSRPLLPAFAEAVAAAFPELGGRAVAVTDAAITKENLPTLPLAMVALIREEGNHRAKAGRVDPETTFVCEFWFPPTRYPRADGSESPFYSFYDYEAIRDRVVDLLTAFTPDRGGFVEYVKLEVDCSEFASVLTFTLKHSFVWCALESDPGSPVALGFSIVPAPEAVCCAKVEETVKCTS